MKNLVHIDTDKLETQEFEKGRKLKAQVSEKRAEGRWKTPVRVMRKKPRHKDKRNYETSPCNQCAMNTTRGAPL